MSPTTIWSQQLNDRAIELRKAWLSFTPEDEAMVKEVDDLLVENIDPLIDDMYAHFLSFPETRAFFPDDATLQRAQAAQKQYFIRLTKGNYDREYVTQRLMVGATHYRIGLDPTWYLGAYNRILAWLRNLVSQRYGNDQEKYLAIVSALTRLVFFDMGLAIESYQIAKERAMHDQENAIQQQREDFVATLTHDLKTPILAANRAIKLLIEGDYGKVEEGQQRILETIHQSNEALYQLVLTLLDVYRYDSGKRNLKFAEHDIARLIEHKVAELTPLATSRQLTISAELPEKPTLLLCDIDEIARVIQNLIDNSMKFTAAGGKIIISMQQQDGTTRIAVTDTGKGIADEDKPKLFQRFWAAASSGRYYASTGLGLYLCRKIVESHAGQIACESQLGKGSSFFIILDAKGIAQKAASQAETPG